MEAPFVLNRESMDSTTGGVREGEAGEGWGKRTRRRRTCPATEARGLSTLGRLVAKMVAFLFKFPCD